MDYRNNYTDRYNSFQKYMYRYGGEHKYPTKAYNGDNSRLHCDKSDLRGIEIEHLEPSFHVDYYGGRHPENIVVSQCNPDVLEKIRRGEKIPIKDEAHIYVLADKIVQVISFNGTARVFGKSNQSGDTKLNEQVIVVSVCTDKDIPDKKTVANLINVLYEVKKDSNIKNVMPIDAFADGRTTTPYIHKAWDKIDALLSTYKTFREPYTSDVFDISLRYEATEKVKCLKEPGGKLGNGRYVQAGRTVKPKEFKEIDGKTYAKIGEGNWIALDDSFKEVEKSETKKSKAKAETHAKKAAAKAAKQAARDAAISSVKIRKNTKYYWLDRVAQENAKSLFDNKDECERLLRQLYKEQGEELKNQLNEVFLKMVSDKADGKIYTNDLYRTDTYNQLLQYFNKCAEKIGGKQTAITEDYLIKAYEEAQKAIEEFMPESLKTPSGEITTSFVVPEAIDAKQAIHQTWCLDGREFSDRIWKSKTDLIARLTKNMADSVARGVSPYEVSQDILKAIDVDEYCAMRIAKTEICHAQIKGSVDKYKSLGYSRCKFVATDGCDDCEELSGQVFTLDEILTLIPKHPSCECRYELLLD